VVAEADPARTPRFDLFPFAGCTSTYGKLDLADDTLPQASTSYFSLATRANRIIGDLVGRPFSAGGSTRKYIIYYDGPVSDVDVCGEGGGLPDLYSNGPSWSMVFVQSCALNVGDGNHAAHVAAHELLHSLGGVPAGAPHECAPPNDGHVCDSIVDILYPFISSNSVFDGEVLDFNRDDYYGTGGRFDIRNSAWLERLDAPWFALTVAADGAGAGKVVSDVGAIDCPATSCSSTQEPGTKLILSATAASGSRFAGWSGACTGSSACTVTLDAATNVTATFEPATHLLAASVSGKGKVISSPGGIACPARCSFSFAPDAAVSLRAVPAAKYTFAGWSGACHAKGVCKLTLSADATVRATFKKKK